MTAAIAHRGPDQDGIWRSPAPDGVVFGHRRLSILDLSDAGRQPMTDTETGVVIVFNGECYNYKNLRRELEACGRRFTSQTDTEVVLAAYVEWGQSATARLRGMFALALWDPRDSSVLLVRDRLGIKPLYYYCGDGWIAFASELRALIASDRIERRLDPVALESYLWHGFIPGPKTIVSGIRLLEPGSAARIATRNPGVTAARYWRFPQHDPSGNDKDAVDQASADLHEATSQHLASDVPLGIFLSGGIDSAVVTALAAKASSKRIATFNISFDEQEFDESPYARAVAERLGTNHHEIRLTESDFDDQLEQAMAANDQPTFDAINTYFVSRAVKDAGLSVALTGTGGDELLGGYGNFVDLPRARKAARVGGLLPQPARRLLARVGTRLMTGPPGEVPPQTYWGKLGDVFETRGDLTHLYQVSTALFRTDTLRDLIPANDPQTRWGLEPDVLARLRRLIDGEPLLSAISMLETSGFLQERLLRDTDASSMAVSLEVRLPLIDHRFIESLCRVSDARRFRPLMKKRLLLELADSDLPPEMFDREKTGFELPLEVWCRRRLAGRMEQTFHDADRIEAAGLRADTIAKLWRAFSNGAPGVHWSRIWAIYALLDWCQRHRLSA